jgi:anti-anti-sigma factor
MPAAIGLQTTVQAGVAHVSVTAKLDLGTRQEFEALIDRLHTQHAPIRLDLSRLEFMDAAGLHALERVVESSPSGRLQLQPYLRPQVGRLLQLVHPERLLCSAEELP